MTESRSPSVQEAVFPERKKRWQGTQLMNLLLRPLLGPLVRPAAALGLRADALSVLGIAAYLAGAWQYARGLEEGFALGTAAFGFGLVAELLDGSLARLRGPSPLGHFLSQLQAELYVILLLPSLGIGLYRAGGEAGELLLLLAGVFGGFADLLVRIAIEKITLAHPEEDLRARLDAGVSRVKRLLLAQILPDHPSFRGADRALRVLRENLYYSSGVQPLALLACILAGRPDLFVLGYGLLNLAAWFLATLGRGLLMVLGGGRIL